MTTPRPLGRPAEAPEMPHALVVAQRLLFVLPAVCLAAMIYVLAVGDDPFLASTLCGSALFAGIGTALGARFRKGRDGVRKGLIAWASFMLLAALSALGNGASGAFLQMIVPGVTIALVSQPDSRAWFTRRWR
ncbi:hypothetical protein ACPA54_21700 [Uniformispora flossi]|uniref:hypothetical protein n=1 Tax=Uniformispora flossi TaxID=3390723 RepID=UPI003C3069FF